MTIYLRTEKIISDWTDYNGHMNLAFYIHLFDQGWDVLLDKFEMGGESAKTEKRSTFAVESHTKYIQEVNEGDEVDINLLFLDRDVKRMVYQLEIFNKNGNYRAATTEVCSLYVNLDTRRVTEIEPHKQKLMDLFIKSPGVIFSRDEIIKEIKGIDAHLFSRSIDILISRLRHKIEDDPKDPQLIKTIWGKGYMFVDSR